MYSHLQPLELLFQSNVDEPLSLLDILECLRIAQTIAVNQPEITTYTHVDDALRTFVYAIHKHFELPSFDIDNPVCNIQLRTIITTVQTILEMITTDQILLTAPNCIFESTISDIEHLFCDINDQDIDKVQVQQSKMILAGMCPVYHLNCNVI